LTRFVRLSGLALLAAWAAGCGKPPAPTDAATPVAPVIAPPGEPTQGPPTLSDEVADAWTKAGFRLTWTDARPGGGADSFRTTNGPPDPIPEFNWGGERPPAVKSLPAPNIRFAVNLVGHRVTTAMLTELAAFPTLHTLTLPLKGLTDDGLKALSKLKGLRSLRLQQGLPADFDEDREDMPVSWKPLGELTDLRELLLGRFNTAELLPALAPLKGLRVLAFSYVTNANGLKAVGELAGLEVLVLGGDDPAGGLTHLAGLKRLRSLSVSGGRENGILAEAVAKLTGLRAIALGGFTNDAGVKHLAAMPHLEALSVGGLVTDACVPDLCRMTALKELNLVNTGITDAGFAKLTGLKLKALIPSRLMTKEKSFPHYLELLDAPTELPLDIGWQKQLTDDDMRLIGRLTSLEEFILYGPDKINVTDTGAKHLTGLTRLRRLMLVQTNLSDAGAQSIAEVKALEGLDLSGNRRIGTAGMKHLATLPRLRELVLVMTGATDDGLRALADAKSLESLVLDRCPNVTDAGMKPLATLPRFRHLDLMYLPITDAGLKDLAASQSIRLLRLVGTKVTAAGVAEFRKTHPQCKVLWQEEER
jgi:hypothetical protein